MCASGFSAVLYSESQRRVMERDDTGVILNQKPSLGNSEEGSQGDQTGLIL